MKAVAVIACLVIVLAVTAKVAAQEPAPTAPPKRVSVAVTTTAVRAVGNTRTDVLLLWNRDQRSEPIGHAVKACIGASGGGILGGGLWTCTMTVSLPLGKVAASGTVHDLRRYTLITTGGTGAYSGVSGALFVRSVSGDGVRRMTFFVS